MAKNLMQQLSLKVTENLYQALTLKAQENELSLSETMRECLQIGLKYFRQENLSSYSQKSDIALQKRAATHSLFTYCLLEQFIKSTVENGEHLCELAESKAEKLTLAMLQKTTKNDL